MDDGVERLLALFPDADAGSDLAALAADEIEFLRELRAAQGRTIRALQQVRLRREGAAKVTADQNTERKG